MTEEGGEKRIAVVCASNMNRSVVHTGTHRDTHAHTDMYTGHTQTHMHVADRGSGRQESHAYLARKGVTGVYSFGTNNHCKLPGTNTHTHRAAQRRAGTPAAR